MKPEVYLRQTITSQQAWVTPEDVESLHHTTVGMNIAEQQRSEPLAKLSSGNVIKSKKRTQKQVRSPYSF